PALKILKARFVPSKCLVSLIENTKGHLAEISIDNGYNDDHERLIKTIYQNCPRLKYLELYFNLRSDDSNILAEFKMLLITCQCLDGLVVTNRGNTYDFNGIWDNLFKVLVNSSPAGLFKFKFR